MHEFTATDQAAFDSFNDPLGRFLDYCAEALQLAEATKRGAQVIVKLKDLSEFTFLKPVFASSDIPEISVTAKRLLDQDLSMANAHTLMGVWGSLESTVDDMCIGWLNATGGSSAATALGKVKVVLGDYLALTEDERWAFAFEAIKRDHGSAMKVGAGQFESMFSAVGLGGPLDEKLRDSLLIVKAVRNLFAHRAGRVDQKFLKDCPVTQVKAGELLVVSQKQLAAMISIAIGYLNTVENRVSPMLGLAAPKNQSPLVGTSEELLSVLKGISSEPIEVS